MITYLTGLHRELYNLEEQAPVPQGITCSINQRKKKGTIREKKKTGNSPSSLFHFVEFSYKEEQVMNKLDTLQESVDQVE